MTCSWFCARKRNFYSFFFCAEWEGNGYFFGNCLEALFSQLFSELLSWLGVFINEGRALGVVWAASAPGFSGICRIPVLVLLLGWVSASSSSCWGLGWVWCLLGWDHPRAFLAHRFCVWAGLGWLLQPRSAQGDFGDRQEGSALQQGQGESMEIFANCFVDELREGFQWVPNELVCCDAGNDSANGGSRLIFLPTSFQPLNTNSALRASPPPPGLTLHSQTCCRSSSSSWGEGEGNWSPKLDLFCPVGSQQHIWNRGINWAAAALQHWFYWGLVGTLCWGLCGLYQPKFPSQIQNLCEAALGVKGRYKSFEQRFWSGIEKLKELQFPAIGFCDG